jgi:hypothetical protein
MPLKACTPSRSGLSRRVKLLCEAPVRIPGLPLIYTIHQARAPCRWLPAKLERAVHSHHKPKSRFVRNRTTFG